MKEKTKILVPLDGSEGAEDALGEALMLAKALNAEVTLLHVIPIPEDVIGEGATSISIDEHWQAPRDRGLAVPKRRSEPARMERRRNPGCCGIG